jgi:transcriptional regulator with XRE-family HTH domain
MNKYYEELNQNDADRRAYLQEATILEVTELVCKLINEKKITRTELARKMNVSKSQITQMLDGEANLTLRSLSDMLWALDSTLKVSARECDVVRTIAAPKAEFNFSKTEFKFDEEPETAPSAMVA